jgi:hypothetical protein
MTSEHALRIDRSTGIIHLPSGRVVTPDLTQDDFRATSAGEEVRANHHGTLPWMHYRFGGGEVHGHPFRVHLVFYDQMLVSVTMSADLYPPGQGGWSNVSRDVDAATVQLHYDILIPVLGRPTRTKIMPDVEPRALALVAEWDFTWGRVWSGHSPRDGNTSIDIGYGDRDAEARRLYKSIAPRQPGR